MPRIVTDAMRSPDTPPDVEIRAEAPEPQADPTLGVPVILAPAVVKPKHRLVTIGDSLTHGFQSLAIHNTDLSYPAIIAWEMGWDAEFRRPLYNGHGGLPLNIEYVIRDLESRYGDKIDFWELGRALFRLRTVMDEIEDWWERGTGSHVPKGQAIMHNLAVYGWDLRDALERNADKCAEDIEKEGTSDAFLSQGVQSANERAALRVLNSARDANGRALSPVHAAQALGQDGGIETLIVFLGANNALATVVKLEVKGRWSVAPDCYNLDLKHKFYVWQPAHFQRELELVVAEIKKVNARHVIWETVPHVTIPPVARGVGNKVAAQSRYFPYYTRPWIADAEFDHRDDPHITEQEARAVDSAIDQYNQAITAAVRDARKEGRDWFLLDTCGLLDRLAARRYKQKRARPEWWTPYDLPPDLKELRPVPNSLFFASGPRGRTQGGLFSLDGVHPTTIAYGIVAQEVINVIQLAGVKFFFGDGKTERTGPVRVDFKRLIARDTLISDPPRSVTADLCLIGWLDEKLDLFTRAFRRGFGTGSA